MMHSSVSRMPPPLVTKPRAPLAMQASVLSEPIRPTSTPLMSSTITSPSSICSIHG